ncbi:unnamed protein product [Cylicostephanus goldi]|uniref:ZP domain-containing protein n=1 Tax=Cylicostephanus goldi TaxID=71465 RepID=A0A3P7MZU4_CYLGO|nr:unnamed protein product [Cylicostephanus goldi]
MFGVLINNCYVTDGFGKKADVINDKGCPVDPILITGIRYSADLQRAYAESSLHLLELYLKLLKVLSKGNVHLQNHDGLPPYILIF